MKCEYINCDVCGFQPPFYISQLSLLKIGKFSDEKKGLFVWREKLEVNVRENLCLFTFKIRFMFLCGMR